MTFTEKFGAYVSPGDAVRCEVDGFDCVARIKHDADTGAPWKEHDGHGPVTGWVTRDKAAGERVLCSDRQFKQYYDFAEAVKIAKRDKWGPGDGRREGETPAQYAVRAVEADYAALKAWANDQWAWSGVVVTVSKNGIKLASNSLWGVERNYPGSDNSYLTEVANEMLPRTIEEARETIQKLVGDQKP